MRPLAVVKVEGPIEESERRFYSEPHCAECHEKVCEPLPIVMRVKTSGGDLSVFVHRTCLSSLALAGQVTA